MESITDHLVYLNGRVLPIGPVKITAFATVIAGGSANFMASCVRMHERGDGLGLTLLTDYSKAIDALPPAPAQNLSALSSEQAGTVDLS